MGGEFISTQFNTFSNPTVHIIPSWRCLLLPYLRGFKQSKALRMRKKNEVPKRAGSRFMPFAAFAPGFGLWAGALTESHIASRVPNPTLGEWLTGVL